MNPPEATDDFITLEADCESCGSRFRYETIEIMGRPITQRRCDPCTEKANAEAEAQEAKWKAERDAAKIAHVWGGQCPERFMMTDIEHPEYRRQLHDKVIAWRPSSDKPWLGIVGMKGSCKTRIALLRMKNAIEAYPDRDFMFLPSYKFSELVFDKFGDDSKNAKAKLKEAMKADFLIFDDMGKARSTPAVISALFALADHRHAHNLTTIWTANSTPEEFCEGMPEDVAGPLVRRLKEASTLYAIK